MDTQKQITPEQIAEWRKVPPDTRYNVAAIDRRRHSNDNQKQRTKRGTSQVKYARRPAGWKEWIAVKLLRWAQIPDAPIPVALRPWLPKYQHMIASVATFEREYKRLEWYVKVYREPYRAEQEARLEQFAARHDQDVKTLETLRAELLKLVGKKRYAHLAQQWGL